MVEHSIPAMLMMLLSAWCTVAWAQDATHWLVHDGHARAVLVLDQPDDLNVQFAAEELQKHLELASGVRLPIVNQEQADALAEDRACVVIGNGPLAKKLNLQADKLGSEQYRVRTVGRYLVFVGNDLGQARVVPSVKVRNSPATAWAVHYFLDHELGVRWLWPGEVGTYVPRHTSIPLPKINVTARPPLGQRKLRAHVSSQSGEQVPPIISEEVAARMMTEVYHWKNRHQMGDRARYQFGHAFTDWWSKYGKEHPDLFAKAPPGGQRIASDRRKLCLSNPRVIDTIIAEWTSNGTRAPSRWNVTPNDGAGFCTCANCRAMDEPANQDPDAIWRAQGKLTARYVKFWNRLLDRMREINPNVTLQVYAYSCYRDPPPQGLRLKPGIALQITDSYHAFDNWTAWTEQGAKVFLRPNWWNTGGPAPHLPLNDAGNFLLFAMGHGMEGYDFDSIMGNWGVQGPYYYLIARLGARPDLGVDGVIDEYASAFGPARKTIHEYLQYWIDFTRKAAYPVPAGGVVSIDRNGLFEQIVREHGVSISPLTGSYQVIPYLYTDEVLQPANALLDRADKEGQDDALVRQRIAFLRDGLRHLELEREVLRLGYARTRPVGTTQEQYHKLSAQLLEMRRQMTPRHVIWGPSLYHNEHRRRAPTLAPEKTPEELEMDGL
ncbi:MAG: DUF4838 domain-containing protein [Phycisphaeraceae bacterium]